MKHIIRMLTAVVMLTMLALVPAQAQEAWFPDPGVAFGAQTQDTGETFVFDSLNYKKYSLQAELTIDELSTIIVNFHESLTKQGFTWKRMNSERCLWYSEIECGSATVAFAVSFVDPQQKLASGGRATIYAMLSIPETVEFQPGRGLSGVVGGMTVCIECDGSGDCVYCTAGRVDYGAGYEECIICDGSGQCSICGGAGSY